MGIGRFVSVCACGAWLLSCVDCHRTTKIRNHFLLSSFSTHRRCAAAVRVIETEMNRKKYRDNRMRSATEEKERNFVMNYDVSLQTRASILFNNNNIYA